MPDIITTTLTTEQLAELFKDKARLDWLQAHAMSQHWGPRQNDFLCHFSYPSHLGNPTDVREHIDAARKP